MSGHMDNPYAPPHSDRSAKVEGHRRRFVGAVRGLGGLVCIVVMLGLAFAAFMVLRQGLCYYFEGKTVIDMEVARASLTLGGFCAVGACMDLTALMMLFRGRVVTTIILLSSSVVGVVIVAIVCKPG